MVVAFAIPAKELSHGAVSGRTVYPVQFQVIAAADRSGHRIDLDTLRQFVTAAPLEHDEFLTGIIEVPLPPGGYSLSVVMTQPDGHGAIAHLNAIDVPGHREALAISDLVLGREKSGVQWNSGATTVPLNPLNTYSRGGTAETYFQLSGLTPGTTYSAQFEIFRADDDAKAAPRLKVASPLTAPAARMEVSRSLVLTNLEPARYRVRLTVSGEGHAVAAVAWLTVLK
jgi:hypothetical protein